MKIKSLKLYNFRCFEKAEFNFINDINNSPIFFLIVGKNGSGKTTLLEALYYSCYLRSFKTNLLYEITAFNKKEFSITTNLLNSYLLQEKLHISIDLNTLKKFITLDQNKFTSYKEISNIFRIISINSDDLKIIQDGPSLRRAFIDNIISILDSSYLNLIYKYKRVLENRNALFLNNFNLESYYLWSEKLFELSIEISNLRVKFLKEIAKESKNIISLIFNQKYSLDIDYQYSKSYNLSNNFKEFSKSKNIFVEEKLKKRSIFGAHLDDYLINFLDNKININSRIYSSRGQQKLIILVLKLAQINVLNNYYNSNSICTNSFTSTIILIDDFLADLDDEKLRLIIDILPEYASQIFITSPTSSITEYFIDIKNNFKIINL